MKHINILCGSNAGFPQVTAGGTYRYHYIWCSIDKTSRAVDTVVANSHREIPDSI